MCFGKAWVSSPACTMQLSYEMSSFDTSVVQLRHVYLQPVVLALQAADMASH